MSMPNSMYDVENVTFSLKYYYMYKHFKHKILFCLYVQYLGHMWWQLGTYESIVAVV